MKSVSDDGSQHAVSRSYLTEPDRLAALRRTGLLDEHSEENLDRVARLASRFLKTPVSLVTLVAEDRQLIKSHVGVAEPWASQGQMPLEYSYCQYALNSDRPLVIPDARVDARVQHSPAIHENRSIAYLGIPLVTSGHVLGTLCVIDDHPREWTETEIGILGDLAAVLMSTVQLRQEMIDRKEAVRALEKSAQSFRLLSDVAFEGVLIIDNEEVIGANDAFCNMFGYSLPEILGRHPGEFFASADRDGVGEVHDDSQNASGVEGVRKDLTRFPAEVRERSVQIGGAVQQIKAIVDITHRKTTENELRESEERFRQIADNVADVFWIAEADFSSMLYVNPAYAEVFGQPVEKLYANPWAFLDAVYPGDEAAVLEWIKLVKKDARSLIFRVQRPDGDIGWLHATAFPIENAAGECYRVGGITQDVTDRVKAQIAERAAKEEAEAAKEKAEAANRAKSEFLSRMSHELRTPLNAILGFSQVLELDLIEPENQQSVREILRAGRHLLALINEVLDIARVESGGMAISLEPVDIGEVVRDVIILMKPTARERQVHLPALPDQSDALYVMADRQRLKQVVLNLYSNAIKHNRQGGRVDVLVETTEPDRLRLSIRDTGRGIPTDRLPRLFTPFDRLGAEQSGEEEGTGLGLSLCRAMTQAMGGQIGVESTVDEGSTFWIELALVESPAEAAEGTEKPSGSPAPDLPSGLRILHIEDNPANMRLVERVLGQRPSINLLSAFQGRLGLDLAERHQPELILLDLHLPDISGEEVLLRLRASPRTAHIPVFVVSADAMPRQVQRLMNAGASGYLTKPLVVQELLDVVDKALTAGAS